MVKSVSSSRHRAVQVRTLELASFTQLLSRTFYEVTSAFEREMGMSQARIVLLSHLRTAPELSQAVLQQRLSVDPAAITRQVKQMELDGLVARRADPSDHRFTLVALTAQGRKAADSILRRREAFEARITSGVPTKEVMRALERVREVVRPKRRS